MKDRIKKIRKKLDLTQQEFADKLCIKRNTLASYETGKSNLSDAAVSLICTKCNVNEKWLRTGEGGDDNMFIKMSYSEEISKFMGDILKDNTDSFKKRFISMLAALDESDWESLQKMVELLQEKGAD